ncbi:MAG TPA: M48 family metallopeptidase [Candidatus Cryptobacteroides excrementigallinarum]|nr:M48 family metallopeptidase [Candidatus Cryptobacteroides excrementigallinarum]
MNIDGLEIEVERKPIKNMHLSVYPPDGRVHLSVPDYLTEGDARSYVISKWEWIEKQQADIEAQARQTKREYVSGENHFFFGVRYRLAVIYTTSGANSIEVRGNTMTMRIRKGSTLERRAELMTEWYREQLKEYIGPLVERWAEKLEEQGITWQVKEMKTMWGSCGVKRRALLFNLELARVPKECIEYVVVHELTHLKVQNHNKLFEALLTQRLPGWRSLRTQLNEFIALPL